jgi:hypothetical protein
MWNRLFIKSDAARGDCYIGVYYNKQIKRYVVKMNQLYIGCYTNNLEAFQAYKLAKEQYTKELKIEIKEIIEQGVDFDIPEQDEILEQIFGR